MIENKLRGNSEDPGLYEFTSHTFTALAVGHTAPTTSTVSSAYSGVVASYISGVGVRQRWMVPKTATYRIQAAGAGSANATPYGGATVQADFDLVEGSYLYITCGQLGGNSGAGGGTAVSTSQNINVIICGGGSGATGGTVDRAGKPYITGSLNASGAGGSGSGYAGGGGGYSGYGGGGNNFRGKNFKDGANTSGTDHYWNGPTGGWGAGGGGMSASYYGQWAGGGGYVGGGSRQGGTSFIVNTASNPSDINRTNVGGGFVTITVL